MRLCFTKGVGCGPPLFEALCGGGRARAVVAARLGGGPPAPGRARDLHPALRSPRPGETRVYFPFLLLCLLPPPCISFSLLLARYPVPDFSRNTRLLALPPMRSPTLDGSSSAPLVARMLFFFLLVFLFCPSHGTLKLAGDGVPASRASLGLRAGQFVVLMQVFLSFVHVTKKNAQGSFCSGFTTHTVGSLFLSLSLSLSYTGRQLRARRSKRLGHLHSSFCCVLRGLASGVKAERAPVPSRD